MAILPFTEKLPEYEGIGFGVGSADRGQDDEDEDDVDSLTQSGGGRGSLGVNRDADVLYADELPLRYRELAMRHGDWKRDDEEGRGGDGTAAAVSSTSDKKDE